MAKFTDGELNVMKILWKHGEMKPAEIQAEFGTPIKNPALRSFLTVLLEKGHVKRRLVGKAYYYTAVTKVSTTFKSSLREMVDVFFDGSTDALIMSLIKEEKLTDKELLELRRMASRSNETGGTEKSAKSRSSSSQSSKRKRR